MKTIGIKLADGSFYPILEEGTPVKKTLDLTTVHDNQTTVMVDLYRSETGTLEDAEYVDTLQIDNLVAHPNGEPDISFNVSLDENNKLSAGINDPESGEHSDTTITLVSRTLEERMNQSDYSLSPQETEAGEEPSFEIPGDDAVTADESADDSTDAGMAAAGVAAGGLLAAAAQKMAEEEHVPEETPPAEETVPDEKPDDLSDLDLPDNFDLTKPVEPPAENTEESFEEENFAEPEKEAENQTQDFTEPGVDTDERTYEDTLSFAKDALVGEPVEDNADVTVVSEEPVTGESVLSTGDTALVDEPIEETTFDIPDFGTTESTEPPDGEESSVDDFSLPDFDELDTAKSDTGNTDSVDDFFKEDTPPVDAKQYVKDNTPSNGINFEGLYDRETEEGKASVTYNNETPLKKKTKIPMLICIICALICVLATLLILFVIPSKYNLISMHNTNEEPAPAVEMPAEKPAPQTEEPEIVPAEEPAPAAKADEVVVAPAAEAVVPAKPAEPQKKAADIVYKIKWGDTLWDIADAYYKNPWRYHRIAKYNHIKDPDYIISGTTIKLPAE
jgi:LysM repeat protein